MIPKQNITQNLQDFFGAKHIKSLTKYIHKYKTWLPKGIPTECWGD